MTNDERKQVRDLAQTLWASYPYHTLQCVILFRFMVAEADIAMTHPRCDRYIDIADRILNVMTEIDEPRYTVFDYADGVVNARRIVDLETLLSLNEADFAAAMIWLATDKRETYEDLPHTQPALAINIFSERM